MSLSNIKVNNNLVVDVDNEPISDSSNIARSGGIRNQIRKLEPYQSSHDLSFIDNNGKAVVIFDKGHIKTKEFDSNKSTKIEENLYNSDLDIIDENDNIIIRLYKGHIKTKEFDSSIFIKNSTENFVINCLGDSITYGYTGSGIANPTWPQGLANNLNCISNNYGVSATSICNGSSESFVSRLNRMKESAIDVLLIFGGTNDYGDKRASTLGTISDEPTQGTNFYASFKYLIESAISKYPMAIIAVITPIRRQNSSPNLYEISLENIVNAEIDVANMYSIPVLDLYHHGSLNPSFTVHKNKYAPDGLHPNQDGINLWLIPRITTFVENMISYKTGIRNQKTCTVDNLTFNNGHFIYDSIIHDNNTFAYTDYIITEDYHNFEVPYAYDGVGCGYDENFQYIESYNKYQDYPTTPQQFSMSNNVKYIRVNKKLDSNINFYVLLF